MEHSSKTKQILLSTVVMIIAVPVLYIMLFINIKEKNNNVSALTNEVDIVLQKEIKLRSVKFLIRDTLQERADLDSHFVADDEIIDFIETIENLGADSGAKIEITNVSISSIEKKEDDQVNISELLNLDFKIKGRFIQMFHFLSMLEKLPFKIDILRVNFENISEKSRKIDKTLEPWNGFFSITTIKLK